MRRRDVTVSRSRGEILRPVGVGGGRPRAVVDAFRSASDRDRDVSRDKRATTGGIGSLAGTSALGGGRVGTLSGTRSTMIGGGIRGRKAPVRVQRTDFPVAGTGRDASRTSFPVSRTMFRASRTMFRGSRTRFRVSRTRFCVSRMIFRVSRTSFQFSGTSFTSPDRPVLQRNALTCAWTEVASRPLRSRATGRTARTSRKKVSVDGRRVAARRTRALTARARSQVANSVTSSVVRSAVSGT